MIKRDSKGRFIKGSSNPWNKGLKGYTNSGSFTSEGIKGENNPFFGHNHTDITKEKISEAQLGKPKPKVSEALKGRKLSKKHKDKIRNAMNERVKMGIHNFWKGGISKAYKELKHSLRNSEWQDWRNAVFQRDNYICRICGIKSGNGKAIILHPHHIFPVIKCIEENKLDLIYEITNGITLCEECHKTIHGKISNLRRVRI